jgi:hypothetical protein
MVYFVLVGVDTVNIMAAYTLIVHIIWNNKSVFDDIDVGCKHEAI